MSYEIRYERPTAGRMRRGPWIVERDGRRPVRFDTEAEAQAWAERASTVVQQPAPAAPASPATAAQPAPAPRVDRQAARVARLTGLPATRPTGRCHYCGQPLSRYGHCEECI